MVGEALEATRERGIEALVEAFEAVAGRRYPEPMRTMYLGCDDAAMRAAWRAAITRGLSARTSADGTCDVSSARRWATWTSSIRLDAPRRSTPGAEFLPIEGTDHLGMDTAEVDPILEPALRMLRNTS